MNWCSSTWAKKRIGGPTEGHPEVGTKNVWKKPVRDWTNWYLN